MQKILVGLTIINAALICYMSYHDLQETNHLKQLNQSLDAAAKVHFETMTHLQGAVNALMHTKEKVDSLKVPDMNNELLKENLRLKEFVQEKLWVQERDALHKAMEKKK